MPLPPAAGVRRRGGPAGLSLAFQPVGGVTMEQVENIPAAKPRGASLATRRIGGLSLSTIALILAATVLGVAGQLILKSGMSQMGPIGLTGNTLAGTVLRMVTSPYVIGGLLVYGLGTFFWLITLSRLELSVAYPFASLNHVLIFLAAWIFLHEQVNPLRAAGIVVICVGMLLIARS